MALAAILAVVGALGAALALAPARTAEAHANYVESDPPANAVLDAPPDAVSVRFSEPLEPKLSAVRVLDSRGERVDLDDSLVSESDAALMRVGLEPLGDGVYTVAWKTVSTIDGHLTRGAFAFAVGEPISGDPTAALEESGALQSGAEPIIRWILLGGVTLAAGGMAFRLFVSRPTLAGVARGDSQLEPKVLSCGFSQVYAAAAVGAIAMHLAAAAQLVLYASQVYETSTLSALGSPVWDVLRDTEWGRVWAIRGALGLGVCAAAALALFAASKRERIWHPALGLAAAAGVLLATSFTSHAAATAAIRNEALAIDFLHLLATSIWLGGVVALALTTWSVNARLRDAPALRREAMSALVRRFSLVASAAVFATLLTGAYSAWAQVVVLDALAAPHGRALLAKLMFVALLLAVAAVNLAWTRGRLGAPDTADAATRWLRRLLIAEIAFGALALLAVGYLTALEPARQVASREGVGVEGLKFEASSEGTEIELNIEPGLVGSNAVVVSLADESGDAIDNAEDVRVRLTYLDADFGETPRSAANAGGGEYTLDEQTIGIVGAWQAEVAVQRPNAFDARAAFRFEVRGARGDSLAISPSADTGRLMFGGAIAALGAMMLAVGLPFGGWYTRAGAGTMAVGAAGAIVGGALLFGALGAESGAPARNPIPPTQASVDAGRALYDDNCQICHGERGLGDGPAAPGMEPPPADLIIHVPLHPDLALFEFVRDGLPGSAMPPMSGKLSDDEIWHVVNYIRTLE